MFHLNIQEKNKKQKTVKTRTVRLLLKQVLLQVLLHLCMRLKLVAQKKVDKAPI